MSQKQNRAVSDNGCNGLPSKRQAISLSGPSQNKRKQYGTLCFSILFVLLITGLMLLSSADCAYGAETAKADIWHVQGEHEEVYDLTPFRDRVGEIYCLFVDIAYPCAAVAFAAGAFQLLTGDERAMEKGKNQMIFVLLAIAAVIFLPIAVHAGVKLGQTYGWIPPTSPSAQ